MTIKVASSQDLLEKLMENEKIKAALLVDDRGYILDRRGHARALLEEDSTTIQDRSRMESIYLVQAGPDFLIVVFDDKLNFEKLKYDVDMALVEFGMAPEIT